MFIIMEVQTVLETGRFQFEGVILFRKYGQSKFIHSFPTKV